MKKRVSWHSGSSLFPGPRYEAQITASSGTVSVWKDRTFIGDWHWYDKSFGHRITGDKRRTLPDDAKEGLTKALIAPLKPKHVVPPPDPFTAATSEVMNLIEAARSAYDRGDKNTAMTHIGDAFEPLRVAGEALI